MSSTLIHGPSGHPLHPPLTDVAIGGYTPATALAGPYNILVTGIGGTGVITIGRHAMG